MPPRSTRGWPRSAAAHARLARRRRVDRRPRLGPGPLGPLADGGRPRTGRARAADRPLGARSPRVAGEPSGARGRGVITADDPTRPAASSARTPTGARGRPPRGGGPARHRAPPAARPGESSRRRSSPSAGSCVSLGVVACHDPGALAPDPGLAFATRPSRHSPSAGDLPGPGPREPARRRPRSRDRARPAERRPLGDDPDGRARIGWQKLFADGSMGSRTAALLADIEPEPDQPLPPERRRGVWMTDPADWPSSPARAAAAGIATQIHAIGDAAVRAALDVLDATDRDVPLMPRIEHVQLVDPADLGRFAAARDRGQRPAVPPRVGRGEGPAALGRPGRGERLRRGRRSPGRARVVAFGTDAPVEPIDPWPGLALAVASRGPALAGRDAAVRAAGGAAARPGAARAVRRPGASARARRDRGRLDARPARRHRRHRRPRRSTTPSSPAARWPRPGRRLVLIDGEVVFER